VLWRLRDPAQRVVVVAHAGTKASLIGALLGIAPTPWEWERFVSFHASLSELHPIDISDAFAYSLLRFSSIGYIPEELHTR
jgi:probable phosphoglycerate mutase